MTATTVPTTSTTRSTDSRTTPLWRAGATAAAVAAAATTAVAAVAMGADVPVEVDGEQIPLLGFAQLTLFFSAIGLVLAKALTRWARAPRRTFTVTTVVLTALSFVPDLTITATTATKVVLIATHVVAAAIVIPALAGRLPEGSRS